MLSHEAGSENLNPASEGLNSALIHVPASAVVSLDPLMRISAFNVEAERLTGLPAAKVLNQSLEALPEFLQQIIWDGLKTGQPAHEGQGVFTLAPGVQLTLRFHSTIHFNEARQFLGGMVVLQDISGTHAISGQIRQLQQLANLGIVSAGLAHEIRNGFVSIKTFIDLLLQENPGNELGSVVRREVGRIDSIVKQMLRCASPAKPAFAEISLHAVVDQSLQLVAPQLEEKQIHLHREFLAPQNLISGDAFQLEQAFLNLFLNALDAMQPGGHLTIRTESIELSPNVEPPAHSPTRAAVRISISDTGSGIPREIIAHLFNSFFTTKPEGTGLGLPITRRIFTEHAGQINVESEPEKGTTFHIVLPVLESVS